MPATLGPATAKPQARHAKSTPSAHVSARLFPVERVRCTSLSGALSLTRCWPLARAVQLDDLLGRIVDRAQRLEDVEGELGVRAVRAALERVGEVSYAEAAAVLLMRADGAEQFDDGVSTRQDSSACRFTRTSPSKKLGLGKARVPSVPYTSMRGSSVSQTSKLICAVPSTRTRR